MDVFGRQIDYLRISVTDRCNERCRYCLPSGYQGWAPQRDPLNAEAITRVVRVAAELGFRKFRLTGGEPLVRTDVPGLVKAMTAVPGVACVGLSTNGTRLAAVAAPLRAAGLRTVNISLDALRPEVYRRITGGDLNSVLAGVRAALAAGFECVKLNCVLLRGVNIAEVWPLTQFAAEHGLPLRLIELMPVTTGPARAAEHFFPIAEAMRMLAERDVLIPEPAHALGWGPAKYYRLRHAGALVGFISPLTDPHFCATCNKLRLTADGKVRPCLGDHGEFDVSGALRASDADEALRAQLLAAMARKPRAHQFEAHYLPSRPMPAIGG